MEAPLAPLALEALTARVHLLPFARTVQQVSTTRAQEVLPQRIATIYAALALIAQADAKHARRAIVGAMLWPAEVVPARCAKRATTIRTLGAFSLRIA